MYKIIILMAFFCLSEIAWAGKLHLSYSRDGTIYISNLSKPVLPSITGKNKIKEMIVSKATNNNIDPDLLLAIAKVESDFNPNVVSDAGAIGLMQVKPETARRFGIDRSSLYDPERNLEASIRYLKFLKRRFRKKSLVIASYYGGENSIKNNRIVDERSLNYLRSIVKWEKYFRKHGS